MSRPAIPRAANVAMHGLGRKKSLLRWCEQRERHSLQRHSLQCAEHRARTAQPDQCPLRQLCRSASAPILLLFVRTSTPAVCIGVTAAAVTEHTRARARAHTHTHTHSHTRTHTHTHAQAVGAPWVFKGFGAICVHYLRHTRHMLPRVRPVGASCAPSDMSSPLALLCYSNPFVPSYRVELSFFGDALLQCCIPCHSGRPLAQRLITFLPCLGFVYAATRTRLCFTGAPLLRGGIMSHLRALSFCLLRPPACGPLPSIPLARARTVLRPCASLVCNRDPSPHRVLGQGAHSLHVGNHAKAGSTCTRLPQHRRGQGHAHAGGCHRHALGCLRGHPCRVMGACRGVCWGG